MVYDQVSLLRSGHNGNKAICICLRSLQPSRLLTRSAGRCYTICSIAKRRLPCLQLLALLMRSTAFLNNRSVPMEARPYNYSSSFVYLLGSSWSSLDLKKPMHIETNSIPLYNAFILDNTATDLHTFITLVTNPSLQTCALPSHVITVLCWGFSALAFSWTTWTKLSFGANYEMN